MDIASAVETYEKSAERRAELDARDRRYGGLVPGDRAAEQKRSALKGWGPYRAESAAAIKAGIVGVADLRSIKHGRLWVDCGRAVNRWASKLSSAERDALQAETFALIVRWPSHGERNPIDLGGLAELQRAERIAARQPTPARRVLAWIDCAERIGRGTLPLRRDWIDLASIQAAKRGAAAEQGGSKTSERGMSEQPSAGAWRALHAALKQARERSDFKRQQQPSEEQSTDPVDIAALIESDTISAGERVRLPDTDAPEVLAHLLDCSLDAARAVVARAWPFATPAELSEQWSISRDALKVALSRGAAQVRKRWPDPIELLDALDQAALDYRAETEQRAAMALLDYREERDSAPVVERIYRKRASDAVEDWRGCTSGMPADALALLGAARSALLRQGQSYGSERAERIAQSVQRVTEQETRAAKRRTRIKRYGEVDRTYPGASWRAENGRPITIPPSAGRNPIDTDALALLTEQRAELSSLLESASADADRIGELRAALDLRSGERWMPESASYGHALDRTPERAPIKQQERSLYRTAVWVLTGPFPPRCNGAPAQVLAWIDRCAAAAAEAERCIAYMASQQGCA